MCLGHSIFPLSILLFHCHISVIGACYPGVRAHCWVAMICQPSKSWLPKVDFSDCMLLDVPGTQPVWLLKYKLGKFVKHHDSRSGCNFCICRLKSKLYISIILKANEQLFLVVLFLCLVLLLFQYFG